MCAITLLVAVGGCAGDGDSASHDRRSMEGVRQAEATVQRDRSSRSGASDGGDSDATGSTRPALIVAGETVPWSLLLPMLGEAAGASVVEEAAVDALARREFRSRGWTIGESDLAAEESALADAMERAAAGPARAGEVLSQMKKSRGLGPVRYRSLLERNAMLRRLVRDECEPTAEQVAQGVEVRHGPRVIARIIVTGSQVQAAAVRSRVEALPEPSRAAAFAEEAFRSSIDPSRDRGGLLEPISPVDASYAAAVRGAIKSLRKDQISPIVALDNGFAILLGVGEIPGRPPPADASAKVRAEIRARLERVAMDQWARRALAQSPPTVFDSSLNWAWESRR
jgi:parvulin-like peptidyl-prolyl isomerase